MEYHELAHEVFLLGVGAYAVESAFVVGYGLIGAGFGVGGHFDGGEHLLDFAFDAVYVDVTHHYDSLLVGGDTMSRNSRAGPEARSGPPHP